MPERQQSQIPLTPTQAEGERDPAQAARERGADSPVRSDPNLKPSQAEGERLAVEGDPQQREAPPTH